MLKNKKIIILISCVAILIITMLILNSFKYQLMGSDSIVATIGDEKITKADVEDRIILMEISNESNQKYREKYFQDTELPEHEYATTDFEDILEGMIKSAAIRQQLKKLNQEVSFDVAIKLTEQIITDDSTYRIYSFVLTVIEEKNIDKNKYMAWLYSLHYDALCNTKMQEYFEKNIYDSNSSDSLSDQFNDYIEGLVDEFT